MTGVETAAALGTGAAAGGAAAGGLTAAQMAALAVSLGGTAASIYGTQQQASERRDILNRQMEKTREAESKSATMVNKEGTNYQGDARAAAMQAQQQATYDQSQKDLGSAPTIINGAGDAGAVSSDYLASKAGTALSEGRRLTAIARELAKTRAPGQLQQTEGLRRANLAGDLQSMWSTNKNQAGAAEADAQSVQEPWWGQLGKVAAAGAGAYGASLPAASGAGTAGVTGANGAFLGEGTASGVPAWDAAKMSAPMWARPRKVATMWGG